MSIAITNVPGLLLRPRAAASYLGVGQSTFYELRKEPGFPSPVDVPGRTEPHYSREDLRAWVRGLPRKKQEGAAA